MPDYVKAQGRRHAHCRIGARIVDQEDSIRVAGGNVADHFAKRFRGAISR